jgi:hypothetical protein
MSDAQDFHEKLMGAVRERLSAIAGNEEKLVEAWVAQHGFKPDECEIVRQMQNGTTRMWVAKRGEFEELHQLRAQLKRYEEREPAVRAIIEQIGPDSPLPEDQQPSRDWAEGVRLRAKELRDFPASLAGMLSLAGELEECEALKLRLFEEREPLVKDLVLQSTNMVRGLYRETLREASAAVRDFKVTP